MYFPDRGCVRPLRHLYGYATAPTHRGANLRPALSPKIFHFFVFLIDKGGLMRRGFIGISRGLLRRGTKETRCCAPCCGGAVAAGRPSSAAVDRSLLPAGRSAANPPHTAAAVDRRDRQTDGRTADSGPLHRPCSAYYASSVNSKVEKSLQKRQKLIQRLDVVMSEQLHVFETRRRRTPCVSSGRRR